MMELYGSINPFAHFYSVFINGGKKEKETINSKASFIHRCNAYHHYCGALVYEQTQIR